MADEPCVLVKRCNSNLSCCGIVLDSTNGIVLTVASLFLDLLPQVEKQRKLSSDCPFLFKDDFATATSSSASEITVELVFRRNREEDFRTLQGCVVLFWRDHGLQRIAERIFPSSEWKFEPFGQSEAPHAEETGNEVLAHRNALSDFVLIQAKNLRNYFSSNSLNLSTMRGSGIPTKGDTVFVLGTPFGSECPPVFYNSISKGIVSNIVGTNNEMIITDARCVPGCEGCVLYVNSLKPESMKTSGPYGIVLAPFCWRNGEWIGITVACSLGYLLHNLWTLLDVNISLIPQNLHRVLLGVLNFQAKIQKPLDVIARDNQNRNSSGMHSDPGNVNAEGIIKAALSSVVMVQCGSNWGSGIIIDAEDSLIATCSHVIQDYHSSVIVTENKNINLFLNSAAKVTISQNNPNSTFHKAQVLYATREGSPLDFALLKVQPNRLLRSLKPRLGPDFTQIKCSDYTRPLYKGEEVLVVGFPLFASHLNMGASLVSGVISNIAYADNQPVLLQSTAAVHCGASGGALVSMETGELLGMVTSQTKDANLSSAFPHVNFSIPVDLLYKLVSAVKSGTIEVAVQALVSDSVESVWHLKNILNEKPQITSKL